MTFFLHIHPRFVFAKWGAHYASTCLVVKQGKTKVARMMFVRAKKGKHMKQRYVAIVPPRKAMGKIPALVGAGVIVEGDEKPTQCRLESMDDVRLFVRGIFPTKWRKVELTEDVSSIIPLHRKYRDRKKEEPEESFAGYHPTQLEKVEKRQVGSITTKVVTEMACEFAGVSSGDIVASFLGSTGARVLAGLIHRIKEGVTVKGITVFGFMAFAPDCPDEERASVMAKALVEKATLEDSPFYPVFESSLPQIKMGASYDTFVETQQARIAQGNRVFASASNRTFLDPNLFNSDDSIETLAEKDMETDVVHMGLIEEEERLKKELGKLLEQIPIYVRLRERVKGAAVSILAPIIASTIAIRRFPKMGSARSFWGTGLRDGKFMKMTTGQTLGYHPGCRQAMYQFGQQIIKKNAQEFWCSRYAENVAMNKESHPNPDLVEWVKSTIAGEEKKWVESGRKFDLVPGTFEEEKRTGKKVWSFPSTGVTVGKGYFLYNPGHLLKMALWRTLTEWSDWLYWFWRSFEGLESRPPKVFPPEDAEAMEKTATEWFAKHPAKVPKGYKPPMKMAA